jgi:RHS repeat-associated protein
MRRYRMVASRRMAATVVEEKAGIAQDWQRRAFGRLPGIGWFSPIAPRPCCLKTSGDSKVSLHQKTESFANWLKMARQVACCWVMAVLFGLCGIAEAQTVYFHNDIAGTPIAASDENGNLLWQESYRPYGERMLKPAAAKSNSQWFHGKSTDADTGMEDFGARNYDPVLGRFLSIDPVDFSEKSIHSFNRYGYGNNNPLRYVDPDGRVPFPVLVAALWEVAEALAVRGVVWFAERQATTIAVTEATAGVATGAMIPGAATVTGAAGKGAQAVAAEVAAAKGATETTRVGRWMSPTEFKTMSETSRVVEGAGGRTYVVNPANPGAFTSAGRGSSIYAEFDVPTSVLRPGSKPEWSVIPGPNVTTRLYGPAPVELTPATCIVCVIGKP